MDETRNGTWVYIREWQDMVSEFGLDDNGNIPCNSTFVSEMRPLCGQQVFTVIDGSARKTRVGDRWWFISDDMIDDGTIRKSHNLSQDDKDEELEPLDMSMKFLFGEENE